MAERRKQAASSKQKLMSLETKALNHTPTRHRN